MNNVTFITEFFRDKAVWFFRSTVCALLLLAMVGCTLTKRDRKGARKMGGTKYSHKPSETLVAESASHDETSNTFTKVESEAEYLELIKKAKDYEFKNNYEQAISFYQDALKIHDDKEVQSSLSKCQYNKFLADGKQFEQKKMFNHALVAFERAKEINNTDVASDGVIRTGYALHINKGRDNGTSFRWSAAVKSFEAAQRYKNSPEIEELLKDAKKMQVAINKWKESRVSYVADLENQWEELNNKWYAKLQASQDRFFSRDFGPGEHINYEHQQITEMHNQARNSFRKKREQKITQWERNNPRPKPETVLQVKSLSVPDKAVSSGIKIVPSAGLIHDYANSHVINADKIKKITYKGESAEVTSEVPDIFYGTYKFVKRDMPHLNKTFQFNKDGTGFIRMGTEQKKYKIKSWGVLVEKNRIFVTKVSYFYYEKRTVPAMVVAYVCEDGTAGYNSFFINDGNASTFGPYGAVQKNSASD